MENIVHLGNKQASVYKWVHLGIIDILHQLRILAIIAQTSFKLRKRIMRNIKEQRWIQLGIIDILHHCVFYSNYATHAICLGQKY